KLRYWHLIHLIFKDVILPGILDESTTVNLSSIIQGNNVAVSSQLRIIYFQFFFFSSPLSLNCKWTPVSGLYSPGTTSYKFQPRPNTRRTVQIKML
ncbi:hypothetical protein MKW98_009372, partial [Papaver atlanticum]